MTTKFEFYKFLRQNLSDVDWYADILDFLTTHNLKHDGSLSSVYPAELGKTVYTDWDDIIPGGLLFGHYDFFIRQLRLAEPYLYEGLPKFFNGIVYSWRTDEFIGGLLELNKYQSNKLVEDQLDLAFNSLKTHMITDDNIFIGIFDPESNHNPPIEYSRSGGTLEVLVSTELDLVAYGILDHWATNPYFQKYGLFPDKWIAKNQLLSQFALMGHTFRSPRALYQTSSSSMPRPFLKKLYMWYPSVTASLMKDNSNLIFAFIEAWKSSGNSQYAQVILNWCDNAIEKLVVDGFVRSYWTPNELSDQIMLSQNFTLVDILCDVYAFVEQRPKLLDYAIKIVQNWISLRWEIGLIPSQPQSDKAILDNQTDFVVALIRIAELTGDTRWKVYAEQILNDTKEAFYTPEGLVLNVASDKTVIDDKISTRYNFLFSKALVATQVESRIYDTEDTFLWGFLQDR